MGDLVSIEGSRRNQPKNQIKACRTCRYLLNRHEDGYFWRCGVNGRLCNSEYHYGDCGPKKHYWEPRPPSFWDRLKDAIIKRISG